LVERLVEQHVVVSHVQMAVIVDPFMFDGAQRAFERRGEGGVGHVVPSRSCFFVLSTLLASKTLCHPGESRGPWACRCMPVSPNIVMTRPILISKEGGSSTSFFLVAPPRRGWPAK